MKQIGVLAILFTVLLAAVITKELGRPDAGALRDQVPLVAMGPASFVSDDIVSFDVAGPGGADAYSVRRDGDRWLVQSTFTAPAASGVVERFVEAAATARGELRLTDAAKLAKFDLTPERATTVTLRGAGDATLAHFALGRSSGTQGAFVRLLHDGADGDAAYAVSKDLRSALGLSRTRAGDAEPDVPQAAHFHDLDVPDLALRDATRIEFVSPHWTLAFEKTGAEWAPVAGGPVDLPLKPSGVRNVIAQLSGSLSTTALVDPARRTELGLDAAPFRVEITQADGSKRAAIGAAGQDQPAYYLALDVEQDPAVIYETTSHAWERVFPPASRLFDFATLDVADDGLVLLEVQRDGETLRLERPTGRAQDDWIATVPAWTLEPRQSQLRNIGAVLRGVRPVDFVMSDVEFADQISISWARSGDLVPKTLRIGQQAPSGVGRLAIFPEELDRIYVIADTTIDRIAPDALSLYEGRPLHGVLADEVNTLTVREPDGETRFKATRGDDGAWTLTAAETEAAADALRVTAWIDRLIELEVTDVADGDVATDAELVIEREGGLPVIIGVSLQDGETRIRLGEASFEAEGEDLVPDAASLAAPESETIEPGDE